MHVLAVAVGGFIGAVLRYIIGYWLEPALRGMDGPLYLNGTLFVNLAGCLILGAFAAASERFGCPRPIHLGVSVGLIGSFTTFSTFTVETLQMLNDGRLMSALAYVFISVAGGVLMAALGWITAGRWAWSTAGSKSGSKQVYSSGRMSDRMSDCSPESTSGSSIGSSDGHSSRSPSDRTSGSASDSSTSSRRTSRGERRS